MNVTRLITMCAVLLLAGGAIACTDAPRADEPPPIEQPPAPAAGITVFFTQNGERVPAPRSVPGDSVGVEAALNRLLEGPDPIERERGMTSWFSEQTASALIGVYLDDLGHAVVDFHDLRSIIPNASTSAGSEMLLGELNATVFQFPEVRSIEYLMQGDCARFWHWLQYDCQTVQRPAE